MGASQRSRFSAVFRGSVIADTIRQAGGIDVHVIAHESRGTGHQLPQRRRWHSSIPKRRQLAGWAVVLLGLPLVTALLVAHKGSFTLATDLLIFLVVVVAAGAVGGPWPGITSAVAGSLLVNYYLVPPVHTFTISERENLIALLVFVAVAAIVSIYVQVAARRSGEARRARAEAEALATSAGTLAVAADPLPALLGQLLTAFGSTSAELRRRRGDQWESVAVAGEASDGADHESTVVDVVDDAQLVLTGPRLSLDDRLALRSHADQLAVALRDRSLHEHAARAELAREADELRTALLQAVSHDLRTPLASIKASVTSLLSTDVKWDDEQRREFLFTVDAETDRLNRLVGNLLDMSRLNAGALNVATRPVYLEDVVAAALASLEHDPAHIVVSVPETLPSVSVDPALLERALANIVANALAWSPAPGYVRIEAAEVAGRIHLRIIDRGPGVDAVDRERVFQPFQRLGDQSTLTGVGLGLAVARGFIEAIGGGVELDDTPGG
jgi:two-component system sensor histidine kinase KdpD